VCWEPCTCRFHCEQGFQMACQTYFPLAVISSLRFFPAPSGCDHKSGSNSKCPLFPNIWLRLTACSILERTCFGLALPTGSHLTALEFSAHNISFYLLPPGAGIVMTSGLTISCAVSRTRYTATAAAVNNARGTKPLVFICVSVACY
jgi:hypothetical protein